MNNLSSHEIDTAGIFLKTAIATGALSKQAVTEIDKVLRNSLLPSGSLENKRMLTAKQAADLLSLSSRTILRYHKAGDIEGIYLRKDSPKSLRFPLSEIERLGEFHNDSKEGDTNE